jgi:hypothetical protein
MARTTSPTVSSTLKTAGAVLAAATVLGLASPASARSLPDSFTSSRCQPLDTAALDVDVLRSGVRVSYAGDRYATCDEAVVISSHASAGPEVDNHFDPLLDQAVLQASALEAAGPAGIHVPLALDPCWAGIQVHRDGDTLVWDEVVGDGCEMVITTDFAGTPHDTEIHVVQQTGNIQPPHIFEHDADGTTVLTGLPDGTWYVKVYEGAVDGTTMSVDGAPSAEVEIVHGVADGSTVLIEHPTELGFTTPAATPTLHIELEPVIITSYQTSGSAR